MRDVLELIRAYGNAVCNNTHKLTDASQKKEDRALTALLKKVLGRDPTPEEFEKAQGG